MSEPGATPFRWAEVGPAGADADMTRLFDTVTEVVRGTGEFRGIEFLHVRARSVLNKVPGPPRFGFSWTINAYRGCSHACTYCFARPTHAYLDLDTGRDFECKIVVKTNAVERVRHETEPKRWAGHHIAMGTNTDPYQRAEGRYRLTQGIVEVLAERRNSFGVLTKSTLVLRDLDLLAGAAAHQSVNVDLSIGTLDTDVWRATEPGTPHPLQRIEAVARLNEAGVPSGVLMGPIIPGLSDDPAMIDATVAAAVEAGARSISHVVLHLRPGVGDVYLEALGRSHPDLEPQMRALYGGRTDAPKAIREQIHERVRESLHRHGFRPQRWSSSTQVAAPRPTASPPTQLSLL